MSNSLRNWTQTGKAEAVLRKKPPRWPVYLLGASLLAGAAAFSAYKLVNRPEKAKQEIVSDAVQPARVFHEPKFKTLVEKDRFILENQKTGERSTAKIQKQLDMGSVLIFVLESGSTIMDAASTAFVMELPHNFVGAVNYGAYDDSGRHVNIVLCTDEVVITKSDANTDRYINFVKFLDSSKIGKEEMKRITDVAMNGTQEEKESMIDELSSSEFLTRNVWNFVLKNRYATRENLVATDLAALALREKLNLRYTAEEANWEQLLSSLNHELTHALQREFYVRNREKYSKSPSVFYDEYCAYLSEFLYADPQLVLMQSMIRFASAIEFKNMEYSSAVIMVPRDLQDELDAEDFLELSEASGDELRAAAKKLLDEKTKIVFGKKFDEIADPSFYKKARAFYEK